MYPGQVIIVPSLNLPAVLSNTRCSPIDRLNMNRMFPGKPDGHRHRKDRLLCSLTSWSAAPILSSTCMPAARNYGCVCYPMMHRYAKVATSLATFEMLKAFSAPYGVVFDTEPDRDGMLDTAVEDLDKPFIAVELGSSRARSRRNRSPSPMRGVQQHAGALRHREGRDQARRITDADPGCARRRLRRGRRPRNVRTIRRPRRAWSVRRAGRTAPFDPSPGSRADRPSHPGRRPRSDPAHHRHDDARRLPGGCWRADWIRTSEIQAPAEDTMVLQDWPSAA